MEDAVRAEMRELLEQFNATASVTRRRAARRREVNERIVKAIVGRDAAAARASVLDPWRAGCVGHEPPQPRQAAVDGRRPQPLRTNPVGECSYEPHRRPQRSRQRPQGHQAGIEVTSRNISNTATPGYTLASAGNPGHPVARAPACGWARSSAKSAPRCSATFAVTIPRPTCWPCTRRLPRPAADPAGPAGRSQFAGQPRGQPEARRVSRQLGASPDVL